MSRFAPQNGALLLVLTIIRMALQHGPVVVQAQEVPFLRLHAMENITTSFRRNVCKESALFTAGQVPLRETLEGLSLTPVLALGSFTNMNPDTGAIDEENPGLVVAIFDELARRAGFTWRDSFAVVGPPDVDKGETWTDQLYWITRNFDVSIDYWDVNNERLGKGIIYPKGWYASSIIMVAKNDVEGNQVNLGGWLAPFEPEVWLLILGTIFVSAFAYALVLWIDGYNRSDDADLSWSETFYKSFMNFVGNYDYSPTTSAARMLGFSMSLWSVLIMSAYTANFVSFLVVENNPVLNYQTVRAAVNADEPMCVQATTSLDEAVTNAFPKATLVRIETEEGLFRSLQNDECTIALMPTAMWDEHSRESEFNGECNLRIMGRAFQYREAGFALHSDAGTLCTNLIHDVLNLHMIEMVADGFIDLVWKKDLESRSEIDCDAKVTKSDNGRLGLDQMMGNFFVHFMLMAASIVWAFISRERRKCFPGIYGNDKGLSKDAPSASEKAELVETCDSTSDEASTFDDLQYVQDRLQSLMAEVQSLQTGTATVAGVRKRKTVADPTIWT